MHTQQKQKLLVKEGHKMFIFRKMSQRNYKSARKKCKKVELLMSSIKRIIGSVSNTTTIW